MPKPPPPPPSCCLPITVSLEVDPGSLSRGALCCSDLEATAWRAGFKLREVKVLGFDDEEEEEGGSVLLLLLGLEESLMIWTLLVLV